MWHHNNIHLEMQLYTIHLTPITTLKCDIHSLCKIHELEEEFCDI